MTTQGDHVTAIVSLQITSSTLFLPLQLLGYQYTLTKRVALSRVAHSIEMNQLTQTTLQQWFPSLSHQDYLIDSL